MIKGLQRIWTAFFPKKTKTSPITPVKITTLETFDVFSDVIVTKNDTNYEGWVIERTPIYFNVVYTNDKKKLEDINKIPIERPLNRSEIQFKDMIIKFK